MSVLEKRRRLHEGSKRWRELVLKFVDELKNEGYQYDEIAKITKLSEATVRTLIGKHYKEHEAQS